jgi:hypothetical protein
VRALGQAGEARQGQAPFAELDTPDAAQRARVVVLEAQVPD